MILVKIKIDLTQYIRIYWICSLAMSLIIERLFFLDYIQSLCWGTGMVCISWLSSNCSSWCMRLGCARCIRGWVLYGGSS